MSGSPGLATSGVNDLFRTADDGGRWFEDLNALIQGSESGSKVRGLVVVLFVREVVLDSSSQF
jgi:hypothetical protein